MKPIAIISTVDFQMEKWPPFCITCTVGSGGSAPAASNMSLTTNYKFMQYLLCVGIKLIHTRHTTHTRMHPHTHHSLSPKSVQLSHTYIFLLLHLVSHLNCGAVHFNAIHRQHTNMLHLCAHICKRTHSQPHNGSRQEYKIMEICTCSRT